MDEEVYVFMFIYCFMLICIEQLNDRIAGVEQELSVKEKELEKFKKGITINYESSAIKRRFVEKEIDLWGLPIENSINLGKVYAFTVIEVFDMVEVDGVTWLYVSRPNFAEPVNYKGWIKEEDTVPYTADKVKLVKRPVHVKANTPLYYCDSISDIDKTEPQKYDYQIHCSISEIKDGYALIDLGGSSYWVKERAVIYPEVD